MHSITDQLGALEQIANFSAKLRGHELGDWHAGDSFARANCIHCGSIARVYCSLVQPEMDGSAFSERCRHSAALRAA